MAEGVFYFKNMEDEAKKISSPEGVVALMRDLWNQHQHGEKPSHCQVYMVDLPPVSEEEKRNMYPEMDYGEETEEGCPI